MITEKLKTIAPQLSERQIKLILDLFIASKAPVYIAKLKDTTSEDMWYSKSKRKHYFVIKSKSDKLHLLHSPEIFILKQDCILSKIHFLPENPNCSLASTIKTEF
jgi:hypothetical protein